MKVSDFLHLTFENFKNRKSRVIFTILGVSIGIGATLFLVSFGYGLQQMLLERITTEESLLTFDILSPDPELITIDEKTLKEISEIENVAKVSPKAVFSGKVFLDKLISESAINLIEPDFFLLEGVLPQTGRLFDVDKRQEVIINSSVADLFGLTSEEILGKKLSFLFFIPKEETEGVPEIETFTPKKEFKVVGVIEATAVPPEVYLNRADLLELSIQEYQSAKIKVVDDKAMEKVREKLIDMGFIVSALSDVIAQANAIFQVIQIVLGIFGVVALFVAAIGLINTMTISLLERTSDIGIMRSIGGSASDIKKLFLMESTIIGFLGGIIGIGVGILGGKFFNIGINILAKTLGGQAVDLFYYPTWFILFIILLSTIVGFVAGVWPAKKASKLNALEALRYK